MGLKSRSAQVSLGPHAIYYRAKKAAALRPAALVCGRRWRGSGQLRVHFLHGDDAELVHEFHAFDHGFGAGDGGEGGQRRSVLRYSTALSLASTANFEPMAASGL